MSDRHGVKPRTPTNSCKRKEEIYVYKTNRSSRCDKTHRHRTN